MTTVKFQKPSSFHFYSLDFNKTLYIQTRHISLDYLVPRRNLDVLGSSQKSFVSHLPEPKLRITLIFKKSQKALNYFKNSMVSYMDSLLRVSGAPIATCSIKQKVQLQNLSTSKQTIEAVLVCLEPWQEDNIDKLLRFSKTKKRRKK